MLILLFRCSIYWLDIAEHKEHQDSSVGGDQYVLTFGQMIHSGPESRVSLTDCLNMLQERIILLSPLGDKLLFCHGPHHLGNGNFENEA